MNSTVYFIFPPLPLMLYDRITCPRCSCFSVKISKMMQWMKGSDNFFKAYEGLKSVKEWLVEWIWAEMCFMYAITKSSGTLFAFRLMNTLLKSFFYNPYATAGFSFVLITVKSVYELFFTTCCGFFWTSSFFFSIKVVGLLDCKLLALYFLELKRNWRKLIIFSASVYFLG